MINLVWDLVKKFTNRKKKSFKCQKSEFISLTWNIWNGFQDKSKILSYINSKPTSTFIAINRIVHDSAKIEIELAAFLEK